MGFSVGRERERERERESALLFYELPVLTGGLKKRLAMYQRIMPDYRVRISIGLPAVKAQSNSHFLLAKTYEKNHVEYDSNLYSNAAKTLRD